MSPRLARKNLCHLDLPRLSQEADETLRRVRVFLFSAQLPAWQTILLLAGYSPEEHQRGVFLTSLLSGERSFEEWRLWRALRPPVDPDLPCLVAELGAFVRAWQPRAQAAARAVLDDPEDLEEILGYLADSPQPSVTWRAHAFVIRLRSMENAPLEDPVWRALVDEGLLDALASFDRVLGNVQSFIRGAALDQVELDEIGQCREQAAGDVRRWLDARREQLGHVDEKDLGVLALGSVVPPPGFAPRISMLAGLRGVGSA